MKVLHVSCLAIAIAVLTACAPRLPRGSDADDAASLQHDARPTQSASLIDRTDTERERLREEILRLPATVDPHRVDPVDERTAMRMMARQYRYEAALEDVSRGGAYGVARAELVDGRYLVIGTFVNLPDAPEGYTYRVSLARIDSPERLDIGAIERKDGFSLSLFVSEEDRSAYSLYIVTLVQDEGPDAEGERVILEGWMEIARD